MTFWIALAAACISAAHALVAVGKVIAAKTKNKTDDKVFDVIGKGVDKVDEIASNLK